MSRVDFNLHNALTRWQWGPFSLLVATALIGAGYWYLRGDWLLAARGRRWPPGRTSAFLAGLVVVDLALQSPVATFTGMYFQAHVLQHLLLMVVAPPLLALGAPSTMLLQTAGRKTKVAWLALLRSRPFAVLTHPLPVWALYFGIMFAFFLSSLINVAMHHMALMDFLNVIFLLGGCLYWWPMVGADPIVHWKMGYGARMFNVLLGGPPEVILGLAILSARTPIASMYTLSSTHAGGGLLWISTEIAVIAGFIPIFWQWSRSDQRAAARLDTQADTHGATVLPAVATTSGPTRQALRNDWADWQMTTWEATWQSRARRVPYPHTYSRQAIKKPRSAAFSPHHDDWPPNDQQSSPSQHQTDHTTRSAVSTDASQPSSASTADEDWDETGTPTTNPRRATHPSPAETPATNPVSQSLAEQPTRQGTQTSPDVTSPRVPTGSYRRIQSRRRRQLRWLLGSTAILTLAVVGGPAVFFHLVEGNTPARLSLPAAGQVGAGPTAAGPISGTWVATAGSQAGYRVQEILFGQHHAAVGRTSKISGHLTISGATVTAADFTVDMAAIKSDQPSRDAQFDGYILETYKYGQASFHLSQPIQLGAIPPPGNIVTEQATGQLTLRGTTRTVSFPLHAERVANGIDVNAAIPITFSSWHIPNPSFAVAQVGPTGQIEVLLQLAPESK